MNKKIATLFISLLYGCQLFSQVTDTKKNTAFYQSLLKQLGLDNNMPIYDKTTLETLKKIDFKKTDLNKWMRKDTVKGMKAFFDDININTLNEYKLTDKIGKHPFTTILHEKINNSWPKSVLALSSIVYSKDNKLAVCSVYHFDNPEAASETIYLLQLEAGSWRIAKFLMVSIS